MLIPKHNNLFKEEIFKKDLEDLKRIHEELLDMIRIFEDPEYADYDESDLQELDSILQSWSGINVKYLDYGLARTQKAIQFLLQ